MSAIATSRRGRPFSVGSSCSHFSAVASIASAQRSSSCWRSAGPVVRQLSKARAAAAMAAATLGVRRPARAAPTRCRCWGRSPRSSRRSRPPRRRSRAGTGGGPRRGGSVWLSVATAMPRTLPRRQAAASRSSSSSLVQKPIDARTHGRSGGGGRSRPARRAAATPPAASPLSQRDERRLVLGGDDARRAGRSAPAPRSVCAQGAVEALRARLVEEGERGERAFELRAVEPAAVEAGGAGPRRERSRRRRSRPARSTRAPRRAAGRSTRARPRGRRCRRGPSSHFCPEKA